MHTLKDGSSVKDIRLARIKKFDKRSRRFPIMDLVAGKVPRSYTWRCQKVLDQGSEGSCVGHGCAHELISRPAEVLSIDHKYAKETIYWTAQKEDEWPGGSYPRAKPFYEGTSVLAGLGVLKELGWCDAYLWSFGLDELILGIGYHGPAILGLSWLSGMVDTDTKGFIHATGAEEGGHCILCRAVNVKGSYFTLRNSWGPSWGIGGDCKISFADIKKLLKMDGEAAFLAGRHSKPIV